MSKINKIFIGLAIFMFSISFFIIVLVGLMFIKNSSNRDSTMNYSNNTAYSSTTNEIKDNETTLKEEDDNDFAKAKWGMKKEEVKTLESSELIAEKESILLYSTTLDALPEMKIDCGYLFKDDILFRGAYFFKSEHTNKNDYIFDYEEIKKRYVEKYGKPKEEKIGWRNSLYKDNPEQYGFAVSMGHLIYYSTWEKESTNIILELKGDNFEIKLNASYWSKKIEGNDLDLSGF